LEIHTLYRGLQQAPRVAEFERIKTLTLLEAFKRITTVGDNNTTCYKRFERIKTYEQGFKQSRLL